MTDAGASSRWHDRSGLPSDRTPRYLFGVAAIAALCALGLVSRYALISSLLDLIPVCAVMVPPILFGIGLLPVFGFGGLAVRWRFVLGAALGLGVTSIALLAFGSIGWLGRAFWMVVIGLETTAGAVLLRWPYHAPHAQESTGVSEEQRDIGQGFRFLWLLTIPFVVAALLAASNAPGLIWAEEGYGYDVLEYHLEIAKEYRGLGRIEYLPHNVYANFPSNVEMLYLLNMIVQDGDVDTGTGANLIHLVFAGLAVFAAWAVGSLWSRRCGVIAGVAMGTTGWMCYLSGLAYVENGMLYFGMAATACVLLCACDETENLKTAGTSRYRVLLLGGVLAGFACGCKYTAVPMIAIPLVVAILFLPPRSNWFPTRGVLAFAVGALVSFSPWLIKNEVCTGNPVFPLCQGVFEAEPPGWGPAETQRWERGHEPGVDERSFSARLGALWKHVVADRYQRFGPGILLLAVVGLIGRRRDRVDSILILILCMQLAVWLFATHLYARFAVVFLLPLALLAGRSLVACARSRTVVVLIVLIGGAAWNLAFSAGLIRREAAFGAPASVIYEGEMPAFEYFKMVNEELAGDAKILLVGEARAFYFRRAVEYCVVFNRNPFVQAVRHAKSDDALMDWLRGHGYTHVLVNWREAGRLRGTYGFAPEIDFDLFDRLGEHRLFPLRHFHLPGDSAPYVSVYRVAPE